MQTIYEIIAHKFKFLPKEAAWSKQLPSPVVLKGQSLSHPSSKQVHQFNRAASCNDIDIEVSINSFSKNVLNSSVKRVHKKCNFVTSIKKKQKKNKYFLLLPDWIDKSGRVKVQSLVSKALNWLLGEIDSSTSANEAHSSLRICEITPAFSAVRDIPLESFLAKGYQ